MATNQTAKFTLSVEDQVSAPAKTAANSLEQFRSSIEASQTKVKELGGALRGLKGSSDEVKAAKDELRAKIDAERNAISTNTLAVLKQGTTYQNLATQSRKLAKDTDDLKKRMEADAAKKAADSADKLAGAVKGAGGPVAQLTERVEGLSKMFSGAGAELALFAGLAVGFVAAIAAVTAGAIAGAIAFTKFVVSSRDAARSAGLFREAALGSALEAGHLGNQVDLLATKLATPKAKLNDLSVELSKTRLTGGEIVDTFNAVGQASEAMGDTVGKKFQDILTRGQRFQRLQINPFELQGTGVEFKDVASQLAKNTNRSVADAQQALFQGQVKLDVGAKAIRDVIEKRFGEVNAKKLLSLDTQLEKFHENLANLTKGVNIEPLLVSVSKFFELFDPTKSVTGDALKQMVSIIGNDLVGSLTKGQPIVRTFMQGLVIGALEVGIAFYKTKASIQAAFKDNPALKSLADLQNATLLGKIAIYGLGAALIAAGTSAAALAVTLDAIVGNLAKIGTSIEGAKGALDRGDGKGVGLNIGNGVVSGLELSKGPIQIAMDKIGEVAIAALVKKTEVHSPSKATERVGKGLGQGLVVGVDSEQSNVDRSMANMVKLPDAPSSQGSSGGGGAQQPQIIIHIHAPGATREAVDAMSSPSFLAQMVKTLEDARATGGTSSR